MKHLLVVDDDKAVCSALKGHLESEGYRAFEAYSLEDAREVLSTSRIHAVLLDQNLPDGNGLDFITEIKRRVAAGFNHCNYGLRRYTDCCRGNA